MFRIDKTNARTTDPDTLLLVLEGKQRVQGFELGLTGRPLPRWNLFTGFTYLDSKTLESRISKMVYLCRGKNCKTSRDTALHCGPHMTSASNGKLVPGSFISRNALPTPRTPSKSRRQCVGMRRLLIRSIENIQLRFNAQNLTDELYFDGIHPSHVMPGAGRTFILSGNFRY